MNRYLYVGYNIIEHVGGLSGERFDEVKLTVLATSETEANLKAKEMVERPYFRLESVEEIFSGPIVEGAAVDNSGERASTA